MFALLEAVLEALLQTHCQVKSWTAVCHLLTQKNALWKIVKQLLVEVTCPKYGVAQKRCYAAARSKNLTEPLESRKPSSATPLPPQNVQVDTVVSTPDAVIH